jgi:hypothetical protein
MRKFKSVALILMSAFVLAACTGTYNLKSGEETKVQKTKH